MGSCYECNERKLLKKGNKIINENSGTIVSNTIPNNKENNIEKKDKNLKKKQKKNPPPKTGAEFIKKQDDSKIPSNGNSYGGKGTIDYNNSFLSEQNDKITNTPKEDIKVNEYPNLDMDTPPNATPKENENIINQNENNKFNNRNTNKISRTFLPDESMTYIPQKKTIINKPIIPTMYDAVFKCESIKALFKKGWNYFLTEKFVERMENQKQFCPMCFLGETNKGKTFIINILTGKNLKAGVEYKTEGISCKFSDFKYSYDDDLNESNEPEDNKFLIFDTAGRSEPLLIDPNEKEIKDDLKKIVDLNYKDLKISEDFLKNLLINNSQIILVIVNQLTLAEQIFLYQLKSQRNFEQLFIIHNLFNFETRKDLEDYINNTIVRSIYFDMSKNYYELENGSKNSLDRHYYFVEKQNNNGVKSLIAHFILGNNETKDPWIQKLNKRTIKLIKRIMQTCPAKRQFNIQEILEKELQDENKIDKETKLKKFDEGNIINNEENPKNSPDDYKIKGNFKLDKEDKSINDIKGFPERKEFNVMGYMPDYVFYKNNDTEFVIEVECSGKRDEDISITAKESRGKVYFTILGKKKFPTELNMKDKPFSIYFSVNIEKEGITIETGEEINLKKPTYEEGIYKKIFKMSKDKQPTK